MTRRGVAGCSSDPAESLARTEAEIHGEKAAALRRIASRLEGLIADLSALAAALPHLDGEERARCASAFEATRAEARLYRWYLEVQRESLGLWHHADLDTLYPVPGPLPD